MGSKQKEMNLEIEAEERNQEERTLLGPKYMCMYGWVYEYLEDTSVWRDVLTGRSGGVKQQETSSKKVVAAFKGYLVSVK